MFGGGTSPADRWGRRSSVHGGRYGTDTTSTHALMRRGGGAGLPTRNVAPAGPVHGRRMNRSRSLIKVGRTMQNAKTIVTVTGEPFSTRLARSRR
jgi:hypothetical protein